MIMHIILLRVFVYSSCS